MTSTQGATAEAEVEIDFGGHMGGAAAEQAAKARKQGFDRLGTFKLEDQESAYFMFVNDVASNPGVPTAWITVKSHSFVPTKRAPKDYKSGKKWPPNMSAVCRNEGPFKLAFGDCWICANVKEAEGKYKGKSVRPFDQTYSLVLVMEPVRGTEEMVAAGQIGAHQVGRVVSFKPQMKEIKRTDADGNETGESTQVPDIRQCSLSWKNFYSTFWGMGQDWGSLSDTVFLVTRSGTGMNDTEYKVSPQQAKQFVPNPETPEGEPVQPILFDLADPRIVKKYLPDLPDLRTIVTRLASDDYYNTFFVPGEGETSGGSSGPAAPSGDTTLPSAALEALRARVEPMDAPDPKPADDDEPPWAHRPPDADTPAAQQAPAEEPATSTSAEVDLAAVRDRVVKGVSPAGAKGKGKPESEAPAVIIG
jgi:hypothetical protein